MGGDEFVLEALLDREPAERRLGDDQQAGGDGAADEQPVAAQAAEGLEGEQPDQHDDDRRRDAVAELDHRLGRVGREDAALAQRPAVRAAALGAAAEPGIAHADNAPDEDQGEGGDDREGDEAAEAGKLVRIATSGDCTHGAQATGALSPSSESPGDPSG